VLDVERMCRAPAFRLMRQSPAYERWREALTNALADATHPFGVETSDVRDRAAHGRVYWLHTDERRMRDLQELSFRIAMPRVRRVYVLQHGLPVKRGESS
jgi:hypothetical protein